MPFTARHLCLGTAVHYTNEVTKYKSNAILA